MTTHSARPTATTPTPKPASTPVIAAVVFDLGGVLLDWNPRHLYRDLFHGDDAAMERFLAEVCTPEWNAELDAGRPWDEAIETLSREHPAERELIAAFRDRWIEMLGGAFRDTVAVVTDLRDSGIPLYALTNWSAETFALARPRYPFLDWFAGIVVSGAEGIRKPDPRIFRLLLDRYGLRAATTVFIDDVEENTRAAAALGFAVVHFQGGDALRRDLARLGLPVGRG